MDFICAQCGYVATNPLREDQIVDNGTTLVCDGCGGTMVVLLLTPERYKEHNTFFSKLYNLLQEAVERRAKAIAEIE